MWRLLDGASNERSGHPLATPASLPDVRTCCRFGLSQRNLVGLTLLDDAPPALPPFGDDGMNNAIAAVRLVVPGMLPLAHTDFHFAQGILGSFATPVIPGPIILNTLYICVYNFADHPASASLAATEPGDLMHIDLSNKRVIVTGASRGIGRAIARAFAAEGARVAICARTAADLEAAGTDLQSRGASDVIARAVDVTDTAGVRQFVEDIAARWGGIDVLINNAGQGRGGNLETLTPEQILEHANVLQMGHFRFVQAVVPHMRQQRWGRIVEINALAGVVPTPDGIPSVVNRAACVAMSKSLGMSLAKDNILVNTLNMGWIDTGQWDRHYREMPAGCSREEFDQMVLKVVPLGRFGKPEDVAGMALFLASDYASFISAASIDIAGGMGGQIAYYPTLKRDFYEAVKARGAVPQAEAG